MAANGYKIRSFTNGRSKTGNEYRSYSLTVPNEIAEALPVGMTFVPKMTDEGLLYVPSANSTVELPAWAKDGAQESAA